MHLAFSRKLSDNHAGITETKAKKNTVSFELQWQDLPNDF
jgi:hypothetical protein